MPPGLADGHALGLVPNLWPKKLEYVFQFHSDDGTITNADSQMLWFHAICPVEVE